MRKHLISLSVISFLFFSVSVCLAQQGNRQTRRVAKPTANPTPSPTPKSGDVTIISLAEDEPTPNNTKTSKKSSQRNSQSTEQDSVRSVVMELTSEVSTLSERVAQMEEKQQQMIDLELLSRAEARAENLHQQLFETLTKESDIKGRLAQLEYESRPEVIERSVGIIGTTRPEELRESRRRALQAETQRLQEQLNMIQQNRLRLERDTANADQLVEKLRRRLEESVDNPLPTRPTRKAKEKEQENNDKPNEVKPSIDN